MDEDRDVTVRGRRDEPITDASSPDTQWPARRVLPTGSRAPN
jgi:hypothetical protein